MIERKPITFSKWTPVRLDHGIAYSYVNPADGRLVRAGSDRWMRVKGHIAAAAIASGQETFTVSGGAGPRRWRRIVSITQEEADAHFAEALAKPAGFMVKGTYRQACTMRKRRTQREEHEQA